MSLRRSEKDNLSDPPHSYSFSDKDCRSPAQMRSLSPDDIHSNTPSNLYVVSDPDTPVHRHRNFHRVLLPQNHHRKSTLSSRLKFLRDTLHDHTIPTQILRRACHTDQSCGNNLRDPPVHFPSHGNTQSIKTASPDSAPYRCQSLLTPGTFC